MYIRVVSSIGLGCLGVFFFLAAFLVGFYESPRKKQRDLTDRTSNYIGDDVGTESSSEASSRSQSRS